MPGGLQLPKRLQAATTLLPATSVIEPELLAYNFGQFASVENIVALKQPANAFYARGLRQGPFDLVLCVHAVIVHDLSQIVQYLFTGKGQG